MATVYLAHDVRHDRPVAVKVLRPELAAVMGAERFLAEVRTTANLQHPHILPLFDSGEADGFLYYVMPYVQGESMQERMDRDKQLPVAEAVGIAKAVAGALDYAHRQGVIHRDIKPATILLQDGQPVVADFGIALAVSAAGGGRLTETGLSLGTPYYMSPEQATADRDPGPASDVYSLACVLYEMIAGDPPHTGSTARAVLARILTDRPRPLTDFLETVPSNVAAGVARALAKVPADRFESAAGFAAALDDVGFTYASPADTGVKRRADSSEPETGARAWWGSGGGRLLRDPARQPLEPGMLYTCPSWAGSLMGGDPATYEALPSTRDVNTMIATRRRIAPSAALAAAVALVGATACAIPENWGAKSPQQHLVETLLDTWASPGQRFLEGVVNADTIEGMTQAADRSRNVTLPGMSAAGAHQEWNIQITKADVLPVHAGDAFVQWLGERSRALGSRDFLPRDVVSALSSGSITAVGDVEASFGRTDRTGRSKVDRVAYLMAGKKGKDPAWVLQPRSRTPVMLRDMLVKVYGDMIRNDDSALTCLGEVERGSDERTGQLKCIKQVIDLKFR